MSDEIRFQSDLVDATAFIAGNATVLGHVEIAARASVWFGAVLRGDTDRIMVGPETNVQDLAVLHADPGFPCRLGARVTVGHAAVVHGATIEDDVLIGMRAVILNGARVGSGSVIAAGCVVPEGMQVPDNSLVVGVPGRVKRETNEAIRARIAQAAAHYVELAGRYRSEA
jgi:carbonic anhydrase/acetyltransferase-like protein (isoleucine patch superfamily)